MLLDLWRHYLNTTPQRVKLIDVFMAFLVAVGGLQFVYCVLVGNYVGFFLLSLFSFFFLRDGILVEGRGGSVFFGKEGRGGLGPGGGFV